jgi:hypothetical protein
MSEKVYKTHPSGFFKYVRTVPGIEAGTMYVDCVLLRDMPFDQCRATNAWQPVTMHEDDKCVKDASLSCIIEVPGKAPHLYGWDNKDEIIIDVCVTY